MSDQQMDPARDAITTDLAKLAQDRVRDAIYSVTDLAASAEQTLAIVIGAHSATMAALSVAYDDVAGNPAGTTDPVEITVALRSMLSDERAERDAARSGTSEAGR